MNNCYCIFTKNHKMHSSMTMDFTSLLCWHIHCMTFVYQDYNLTEFTQNTDLEQTVIITRLCPEGALWNCEPILMTDAFQIDDPGPTPVHWFRYSHTHTFRKFDTHFYPSIYPRKFDSHSVSHEVWTGLNMFSRFELSPVSIRKSHLGVQIEYMCLSINSTLKSPSKVE